MTARHRAASHSVASGIFDGLKCFSDFEARISALASNKERGDAFEVFAEAYLVTQKINEASDVWPFESIPLEQRQLLSLDTGRDMGVDGTYQTHDGELRAYQVKFRRNRSALTWDELSTFMGLTDQVSQRVLFTNCEALPSLMRDRSGFVAIRGSDLDRLAQEDFDAMRLWLQGDGVCLPRKQPLPHQNEALTAISAELNSSDRATIVMACGTGKSLVALWAAEQRSIRTLLVLLPSLALVRQLLHEWLRQTSWDALTFQCVCSDPTVAKDADDLIVHQADLDFPVTTESSSVRHFLAKPFNGVKVVFSTYQSAHVVAEGLPIDPDGLPISFDFGVFDEAHKTAGREGRNLCFALDDANLPIRKRLFFTATPRHYNPHRRDTEDEAQVVYSMDNISIYGTHAYSLTFGEAARRKLICNYKVIISTITSDKVTDALLSRGEVIVNGDAVRARQVANQIALCEAVEKYGIKKIFTFHKTVKSAASFVADGSEGIRTHLTDFDTFHVNGGMPTARRDRVMYAFRGASQAVISNARCLTEGVDVPAVDMVAFLSPRRSRVDIVQATGRAMRLADGKVTGYVLVPLYVEISTGESVEAAVSRANFDEVWDVLQSLQEQDDVLAEFIRHVGEQKGRGKGFDDSGFTERIAFDGECLSLAKLKTAVATRCVEELYSSWDVSFGKLRDFKERFGHCNVATGWEEDSSLSYWVSTQRHRKQSGSLSVERIASLNSIGFVWDFREQKTDATWMKWYAELQLYVLKNGHPNVPRRDLNTKLASWVWIQRLRRNKTYGKAERLTTEQVELLDRLSFSWDPRDSIWKVQLEKLREFKKVFGHCDIELEKDCDIDLSRWLQVQRSAKNKGELPADREKVLSELGVNWVGNAVLDKNWKEMYRLLLEYHAEHGNSDVPHRYIKNTRLASWVNSQRARFTKKCLSDERVALLVAIDFTWKHRERGVWEDRLAEVVAYKEKHGHCNIPLNGKENPKLSRFVNQTRVQRNRGALSAERIAKLDAIGFVWSGDTVVGENGLSELWKKRYDELLQYKQAHHNSNVSRSNLEYPGLGTWVGRQRLKRTEGTLHPERFRLLSEAGFEWSRGKGASPDKAGTEESWNSRYDELMRYREAHQNCNVSTHDREYRELGIWVSTQRQVKKAGKLRPERIRLLDAIGFEWVIRKR